MTRQVINQNLPIMEGAWDKTNRLAFDAALDRADANFAEVYSSIGTSTLGYYNVKDFGAVGDGIATDTTAIQAALDAAAGNPTKRVVFPAGNYKTGPLSCNDNGVHIEGSGTYTTVITFVPTGNVLSPTASNNVGDPGVCFDFNKTAGAAILYNCSISGMQINTANTSFTKNAIRSVETSQLLVSDILITNFYGGDSVGIQVFGHELLNLQRCYANACVPIRISRSPIAYSGVTYADHFRFSDMYLRAAHTGDSATKFPTTLKSACVLVDDAVFMSNFTMEGQQAWVGGQYGLYWSNPGNSNSFIYKLKFANIRHEQQHDGSANPNQADDGNGIWGFWIDFTSGAQIPNDVLFENIYISGTSTANGFYLRRVQQATMIDCLVSAASGKKFANIGDVYSMSWINCSPGSTATNTYGSNVGSLRNGMFRQNYLLPYTGQWTFESNPRVTKTLASGVNSNFAPSTNIGGADFPCGIKTIYFTTTAGACSLTGLPPPLQTYIHGERIRVTVANGGNVLTLPHNSGTETTAANRFECPAALDTDIPAGGSRFIEYDATLSKWVVI